MERHTKVRPPVEEAHSLAIELHELGYTNCEAVPVTVWSGWGLPENRGFFKLIDAELTLMRERDRYLEKAIDYAGPGR